MLAHPRVSKRAQVSVFIIISIIVIAVVLIFFIFKTDVLEEEVPGDMQLIQDFVNDCVRLTGENALDHVGERGGYFSIFENSTQEGIAYYFYNGEDLMISKKNIEEEISVYMDSFIYFCINDFEDFSDYEIEQGDAETNTLIMDDKVIFDINYPISVKKGDYSYVFEEFNGVEVFVRLGVMYSFAEDFIKEQMSNKEAICVSCLQELGANYSLDVHMMESIDENSVVFVIRDESSKINEKDYLFYFAGQYGSEGVENEE